MVVGLSSHLDSRYNHSYSWYLGGNSYDTRRKIAQENEIKMRIRIVPSKAFDRAVEILGRDFTAHIDDLEVLDELIKLAKKQKLTKKIIFWKQDKDKKVEFTMEQIESMRGNNLDMRPTKENESF